MIQETPHEFCVVAEYEDGGKFCLAKFMHEEDARRYRRSRKKKDFVVWKLYERLERNGEVLWTELLGRK
jgi:hypothetical protein